MARAGFSTSLSGVCGLVAGGISVLGWCESKPILSERFIIVALIIERLIKAWKPVMRNAHALDSRAIPVGRLRIMTLSEDK